MWYQSIDWNMVCTIVTALAAIIALFQASHQTKLSNKQLLFDRRLSSYSFVMDILQHYELDTQRYSNEKTQHWIKRIHLRISLNEFLKEVNFREPSLEKIEVFCSKGKELRLRAREIKIIFNGKTALAFSEFLNNYAELLDALFEFYFMYLQSVPTNGEFDEIDEASAKKVDKALETLNASYSKIVKNKIDDDIFKQLKLR